VVAEGEEEAKGQSLAKQAVMQQIIQQQQQYSQQRQQAMMQQQGIPMQQSMQMVMPMMAQQAPPAMMPAQTPNFARTSMSTGAMGRDTTRPRKRLHFVDQNQTDDSETDDDALRPIKKPMEAKQNLLHILSTEAAVNTRIHGEFTAFRTSFEARNSLLPHATVRTVLKFFGVSSQWLEFFGKFLEAPLKFVDAEDESPPRLRCRGTPASHVLSNVFGEVVLFCLDFSVNQATNGALLYRLFDDMWFW
jgi:hypothetical protein